MSGWEYGGGSFTKHVPGIEAGHYCREADPGRILSIYVAFSNPTPGFYGPTTTSFNFFMKDYDDKSPVYKIVDSRDCTAVEPINQRVERPMTADEINRMCDLFSNEIGDFGATRYIFRHMTNNLGSLFKRNEGTSEYRAEQIVRSILKERITESLDVIRNKSVEPVA